MRGCWSSGDTGARACKAKNVMNVMHQRDEPHVLPLREALNNEFIFPNIGNELSRPC